jgi:hypothetical protein
MMTKAQRCALRDYAEGREHPDLDDYLSGGSLAFRNRERVIGSLMRLGFVDGSGITEAGRAALANNEQPNPDTARDFLAIVTNGVSGSWARGADKTDTVKRAAMLYRDDHSHLFKIKKGATTTVNVVDVTGHKRVEWNDLGVFVADGIKVDFPVERVPFTY